MFAMYIASNEVLGVCPVPVPLRLCVLCVLCVKNKVLPGFPGCGTHRSKVGDEMPVTEAPFSGKTR